MELRGNLACSCSFTKKLSGWQRPQAYGQRFGPQARRSQQRVLGRSGTPRARVHCWSPKKTGKKIKGQILWHTAVLVPILETFLPISWIEAALDTLLDLAADGLPRGCRPPSKQHFPSIALDLLHSLNDCRINSTQTSFQPNCGLADKIGKETTGALSLRDPGRIPGRVGNCQPPWKRVRNGPCEGKTRPLLRFSP